MSSSACSPRPRREVDWPPTPRLVAAVPRAAALAPGRGRRRPCGAARDRGRLRGARRAKRDPAGVPSRGRIGRTGRRASAGRGAPARGRDRRSGERRPGPAAARRAGRAAAARRGGRSSTPSQASSRRSSTLNGPVLLSELQTGAGARDPPEVRRRVDRRRTGAGRRRAGVVDLGGGARLPGSVGAAAAGRERAPLGRRTGSSTASRARSLDRGPTRSASPARSREPERRDRCRTGVSRIEGVDDDAQRPHPCRRCLGALPCAGRRRSRPVPARRDDAGQPRRRQLRHEAARLDHAPRASASRASSRTARALAGRWGVPMVTLGAPGVGGLSPNGRMLVLSDNVNSDGALRDRSRFAVVDTRTLAVVRTIALRGDYSLRRALPGRALALPDPSRRERSATATR